MNKRIRKKRTRDKTKYVVSFVKSWGGGEIAIYLYLTTYR